jgi:hypothetical protein
MDHVSQALRGHLHSIFNSDPEPILALRVRHPLGAAWVIDGYELTLTVDDALSTVWDLEAYSLSALASALELAGFEIVYLNTAIGHLSATTLLDGAGNQDLSNGDHLTIFTAPLMILLGALGKVLGEGRAAIPLALSQLILPDATHEWADLFGEIFGIPRRGTFQDNPYLDVSQRIAQYNPVNSTGHELTLRGAWEQFFANILAVSRQEGEPAPLFHARLIYEALQRAASGNQEALEADAVYTARIIKEVQRARSNPVAMAGNIFDRTGARVSMREPWQERHLLSISALSGADHLQGAPIYEYHTLQLTSPVGLNWARILTEAEADRPAGTLLLPPLTQPGPMSVEDLAANWTTHINVLTRYAQQLYVNRFGRLSDDLVLSAMVPIPAFRLAAIRVTGVATLGIRGPYQELGASFAWTGIWDARPWASISAVPVEMLPPKTFWLDSGLYELTAEDGILLITADGNYIGVPNYD